MPAWTDTRVRWLAEFNVMVSGASRLAKRVTDSQWAVSSLQHRSCRAWYIRCHNYSMLRHGTPIQLHQLGGQHDLDQCRAHPRILVSFKTIAPFSRMLSIYLTYIKIKSEVMRRFRQGSRRSRDYQLKRMFILMVAQSRCLHTSSGLLNLKT